MYPAATTIQSAFVMQITSKDIQMIHTDFAASVEKLQEKRMQNKPNLHNLLDSKMGVLKQSARSMLEALSS